MPESQETDARALRRASLAVLVACGLVYASSLRFGFVWDDALLITGNPMLRARGNLLSLLTSQFWEATPELRNVTGYYRPVVSVAYVVEHALFGARPFGYHAVNLALHLGCTYLALRWLTQRVGASAFAIASGALFFALHPSKPESVAWIAGCTDPWMTLLVLGCALAATRGHLVLASVCAALSVLAKENALVVPALIALDAYLLSISADERRIRLRAATACGATVAVVLTARFLFIPLPQRVLTGVWPGMLSRVLASIGEYASALLWPTSPTLLRGHLAFAKDGTFALAPLSLVLGAVCVAGCLALGLAARRRPALRPYLADLAWLVLPLAPLINVLPLRLDSLVAERFLYLPSLGAAALLARGAYALEHTKLLRASLHVALCVGLALAFACVTVPRMQAFESDRALWLDELERNPRECYTMYRLANQAIVRKELRQALAISHAGYDQALRDRLRMYEVRFVLLSALSVLQIARDTDQGTLGALRDFYDAIAAGKPASLKLPMFTLSTRFGRELAPLVNEDILIFALPRAIAHARSGDLQGAQTLLEHAVVQAPTHGEAWEQLALVLARQRRFDQARAALSQGKGRVGDPTMLAAAAARVDRAQAVLALPAATPAQRSIHEAHAEIVLGGFARARELLDPELALEPGDAEVIHARTLVDAADQRYDLAHARIEALLRTDPARAGLWKQVLAEVDAIAVQNPAPTQ